LRFYTLEKWSNLGVGRARHFCAYDWLDLERFCTPEDWFDFGGTRQGQFRTCGWLGF